MNAAMLCVLSPLSFLKSRGGGVFDFSVLSVSVPTFRLLNYLTHFRKLGVNVMQSEDTQRMLNVLV